MSSSVNNNLINKLDYSLSESKKLIMAIFIIFMLPLSGMAIDIYTPSLVTVANTFHISSGMAQLTIGLYLLSYGLFQLVTGLLSDAYGRKPLILYGLLSFIILSWLVPHSSNIYMLLIFRFLQGISVAAFLSAGKAVLPELYQGKPFNKIMSYVTSAWALGPVIAPIIGANLASVWSWHASFYFLSIYGSVLLIIGSIILQETKLDKVPIKPDVIFSNLKILLKSFAFIRASLMVMSLYSFLIIFNTLGPFVLVNKMHYSPMFFGYMAFLMGSSYFLGMFTSRFFINKDSNKLSKLVLKIIFIISLLFLLASLFLVNNIYVLIIPSMLTVFLSAFIFSNQLGLTLKLFPAIAGFASAVSGCLFVAGAGVLTSIVGTNHNPSVFYISFLYLGLAVFILLLNICYKKQSSLK